MDVAMHVASDGARPGPSRNKLGHFGTSDEESAVQMWCQGMPTDGESVMTHRRQSVGLGWCGYSVAKDPRREKNTSLYIYGVVGRGFI